MVIGRAEYLYTSPMVQVASEEKHNEAHWIDEARVFELPEKRQHEQGFPRRASNQIIASGK